MPTSFQSPFCFGIVGPGRIARSFARSLKFVPDATLAGIASRTPGKAQAFAAEFASEFPNVRCYDSYEAMAEDPRIDAVYIATLHHLHAPAAKVFLQRGKAVLCEKPLTLNYREASELAELADKNKAFFMEAIWTRFLPATQKLLEALSSGIIGEVRSVKADFGIQQADAKDRWLNAELAGGALLDLGIYNLYFSHLVMGGWPIKTSSTVRIGSTGVDEEGNYFMEYSQNRAALLSTSVTHWMEHTGWIHGTTGSICVPNFFHAHGFSHWVKGKEVQQFSHPYQGPGYQYEAEEVIRCMRAGLTQSPLLPVESSLQLMKLMDSFRAQWGLVYPGER